MIEVCGLTKSFDTITALRDVSFSAKSGELITLLGPNGAGKTTLMRLICGYLVPDAGNIDIDGKPLASNLQASLAKIGYMPENVPLYPEMTVLEYLQFIGAVFCMKDTFAVTMHEVISGLEIASVLQQKIQTLSKGYKRRVGLASVILHHPQILILDEPTEGLDPNQKIEVRKFLREYARKNLVLVSTHLLEEAEAMATRVLVLAEGKIRCDSTVEEMKHFSPTQNLSEAFYNLTRTTDKEHV